MPTVKYTVFDGEIVEEDRGGTVRGYVPDPLGSTRALLDSDQTITDTWSYWPYGEVDAHSGSSPTPFTFVGTLGYYQDITGLSYIRARLYDRSHGAWLTVDRRMPVERAYGYCKQSPTSYVDKHGRAPSRHPSDVIFYLAPPIPPGVSLSEICCVAASNRRFGTPLGSGENTLIDKGLWLAGEVSEGRPWDFKNIYGVLYEPFGNYAYGIATCCLGITRTIALMGAGFYQRTRTGDPGPGKGVYDSPYGMPIPLYPPYGDYPDDQVWINRGYDYCKQHFSHLIKMCECTTWDRLSGDVAYA